MNQTPIHPRTIQRIVEDTFGDDLHAKQRESIRALRDRRAPTGWAHCKSRRALPPGRRTRDSRTRSSKRGRRCKGTSRRSRRRPRTLQASVCTPRETLGLVCTAYPPGSAKERSRRCIRGMEPRARAFRRPARSRRPSPHPGRRLSRRTPADRSTGRSYMPAKANSHSRPFRSSRGAPRRGSLRSRRPAEHPHRRRHPPPRRPQVAPSPWRWCFGRIRATELGKESRRCTRQELSFSGELLAGWIALEGRVRIPPVR
jgi:hypothetical protein